MNRTIAQQGVVAKAADRPREIEEIDLAALLRAIDAIAMHEAEITERFYEIFFERCPDALELFGAHSISEREEMMREAFHSLYALHEGEDWLADNLAALGRSHAEYGVTEDMYPCFVDALIDCGREVLGDEIDEAELEALRRAMSQIANQMSAAGEAAAR